MIEALIGQLWPYIAGAVALLLGWLGLRAKYRAEGRADAEQAQARAANEANRRMLDADVPTDRNDTAERLRNGRF